MTTTPARTVGDRLDGLAGLGPIGLDELTAQAELQIRRDRKYVLALDDLARLLPAIGRDARILDIDGLRLFRYGSVYFDTADLVCFRLTALRRRRRFKIRTRTYLDSGQCWLEVKTEGVRGGTVKTRLAYEQRQQGDMAPGRWFVEAVLEDLGGIAGLAFGPVLTTSYLRSTLYLPATQSRVTIDVDLSWADLGRAGLSLPALAVVETKTRAAACEVDRLLWARGHRPASISKYATGLAALRPGLPSAPWRRLLRRHFHPAAPAGPRAGRRPKDVRCTVPPS
ncbi:VTC domain-containing protein [Amorphoplanes digitatis]|uniref:VTC domain-containing protein n=1 Tax=Actinoplanes digitatis TaxID=1868 RepID=UPI003609CE65